MVAAVATPAVRRSFGRTLKVTLLVSWLGAIAFAMTGSIFIIALLVALRSFSEATGGAFAVLADMVMLLGAVGAVALPLVGWTLMRRVPLGLAAVGSVMGAVVGGVVGEWLHPWNPYSNRVPGVIYGICAGFVLAAVIMSLATRKQRAR